MAIKSDGTLVSWGANWYGQLGDGQGGDDNDNANRSRPIEIGEWTKWQAVTAGGFHSLAITREGDFWAWGANWFGQLGDGTNGSTLYDLEANRNKPVRIGADDDWVSIAAGAFHSLALKSDGSIWAWGTNSYGQLGDGSEEDRNTPVRVGQDTDWARIGAGENYSLAIKENGVLWGWGRNHIGQLGDGTREAKNRPARLHEFTGWERPVGAGNIDGGHMLMIHGDGSLWAAGNNFNGQVGDGRSGFSGHQWDAHTLVQIGDGGEWRAAAGGGWHSIAVQRDGSLWGWGRNAQGELGTGTGEHSNAPVRAGEENDWLEVGAGHGHSLGLKQDGTLWAWGYNFFGQLGNGTSGTGANELEPVFILELGLPARPIRFTEVNWTPDNHCHLILSGGANEIWNLQYADSSLSWQELGSVETDGDGSAEFCDATAVNSEHRWYRALQP